MNKHTPKTPYLMICAFLAVLITPIFAHAQHTAQQQEETAQDQCGYDRRCRIDRIKRLNNLNRRVAILNEEQQIAKIADQFKEKQLENQPRVNQPFGIDIAVTRLGTGFVLGYNFAGLLRIESALIIHDDWIYDYDDNGTYIDGYQDALFVNLSATYFFTKKWFAPYINAGITAGWGAFSNDGYDYSGWDPNFNPSDIAAIHTKYHIISASTGLDVQFLLGLHARLGIEYGYILYNQARYSAGNYDAEVRKGLNKWMGQSALWGPQFHIGWAF